MQGRYGFKSMVDKNKRYINYPLLNTRTAWMCGTHQRLFTIVSGNAHFMPYF